MYVCAQACVCIWATCASNPELYRICFMSDIKAHFSQLFFLTVRWCQKTAHSTFIISSRGTHKTESARRFHTAAEETDFNVKFRSIQNSVFASLPWYIGRKGQFDLCFFVLCLSFKQTSNTVLHVVLSIKRERVCSRMRSGWTVGLNKHRTFTSETAAREPCETRKLTASYFKLAFNRS